ncbi:MAG: CoA transferase [Rhodobacteraceae bacterium]|jgi:alpha-methylacyl-CoA racemase|uniref:CaiB/BaiF CoA transferase family protein n=1 Tax=Albidovulum sp. TaxID=1872424 RepID=UPI001D288209|nr:CaiB/BaiF CoA-transferase family protein [uncultured Defluviimonas sp.]MCB2125345.1 CoA transferase [Paracoccaceae bacterium]MCC0070260.1 CoA transferase [Paracoccaceae bacterium]
MRGPLTGLRIVEIAGLGPTPFAAMLLADMGAEVVRIERPGHRHILGLDHDILNRGRGFVVLDLKSDTGKTAARRLIDRADGVIEGLRPGVMERLGLGPEDFPGNPRLVYGRMTGWGQSGPLAHTAGHDITYIALSGALHAVGPVERPVPPLNLVGDFGGGGMYLAFGMACAFLEAARSGQGQVVDAAISDGTAHLMAMIQGLAAGGLWSDAREANLLDGAAPFYRCYACKDSGFLAVGAIEPKFWSEFLRLAGIDPGGMPDQMDRARWPEARARVAARIAERTRDDWAGVFAGSDACAVPVLTLVEAPSHPHNAARATYLVHDGVTQPAPAPRLSRTPGRVAAGSQSEPLDLAALLVRWGA